MAGETAMMKDWIRPVVKFVSGRASHYKVEGQPRDMRFKQEHIAYDGSMVWVQYSNGYETLIEGYKA